MRHYKLFFLALILTLSGVISCNQFDETADGPFMVTVSLSIQNDDFQPSYSSADSAPELSLSESVKTALILVVDGATTEEEMNQMVSGYSRALLDINTGNVSLSVPLNTSIRLAQAAFDEVYTLDQIIATKPDASYVGLSNAFTIDGQTTEKTIEITLKTNTSPPPGPLPWNGTRQLGGSGSDRVYGMTRDSSGNIFLAGNTDATFDGHPPDGKDALLIKFNSSGEKQWSRLYTSTEGSSKDDYGKDVAVDSVGNIYLTGNTMGTKFGADSTTDSSSKHFILNISADGTMDWAKLIAPVMGPTGNNNYQRVAVDRSGAAITSSAHTGVFKFSDTTSDPVVTGSIPALTNSGNDDYIAEIAINSTGDSYLAYFLSNESQSHLLKYDSALVFHSDVTGDFTSSGNGGLRDVFVDSTGDVYLTGMAQGTITCANSGGVNASDEVFVRKYRGSSVLWTTYICGETSMSDQGLGITVNHSGEVYVVGTTEGKFPGQSSNGGMSDAFLAKFNASGAFLWVRQFGTGGSDIAEDIILDDHEDVIISGHTDATFDGCTFAGGEDIFLLKYSKEGTLQ